MLAPCTATKCALDADERAYGWRAFIAFDPEEPGDEPRTVSYCPVCAEAGVRAGRRPLRRRFKAERGELRDADTERQDDGAHARGVRPARARDHRRRITDSLDEKVSRGEWAAGATP